MTSEYLLLAIDELCAVARCCALLFLSSFSYTKAQSASHHHCATTWEDSLSLERQNRIDKQTKLDQSSARQWA